MGCGIAGFSSLRLPRLNAARLVNWRNPTLAKMAAALAYGLARNHGFVDGNKRAAHMTSRVFLEYNGYPMTVPADWAEVIEAVAAGTLSQEVLAERFAETIGGDVVIGIDQAD